MDETPESRLSRVNVLRRVVGIVVCSSPIVLLLASIAYGIVHPSGGFFGFGFACFGLLFGVLNAYLSFVRPWRYRRRRGSLDGYCHVSGLPLIGTLLVVVAGITGFSEIPTALVGLAALALDTGGLPWFLIWTWSDRSLWDA